MPWNGTEYDNKMCTYSTQYSKSAPGVCRESSEETSTDGGNLHLPLSWHMACANPNVTDLMYLTRMHRKKNIILKIKNLTEFKFSAATKIVHRARQYSSPLHSFPPRKQNYMSLTSCIGRSVSSF